MKVSVEIVNKILNRVYWRFRSTVTNSERRLKLCWYLDPEDHVDAFESSNATMTGMPREVRPPLLSVRTKC